MNSTDLNDESRARRLAADKGYTVVAARDADSGERFLFAVDPLTTACHARARTWVGMFDFLRAAPALGAAAERLGASHAQLVGELVGRHRT